MLKFLKHEEFHGPRIVNLTEKIEATKNSIDLIQLAYISHSHIKKWLMVCGPMYNPSEDSKKNIKLLEAKITEMRVLFPVFNQLIFDERARFTSFLGGQSALTEFYLPIFKSGMIGAVLFLSTWRQSFGARWEHRQTSRLLIPQFFTPANNRVICKVLGVE